MIVNFVLVVQYVVVGAPLHTVGTDEPDIKSGQISISVYIVVGYAMHALERSNG